MNKDKLARTTFVLDRSTSESLSRVARRMGVSRSALVREVLTEPVEMMAKWVDDLPDEINGNSASRAVSDMTIDLIKYIDKKEHEIFHAGNDA